MDWYIFPLILSFAVTLLAQMAVSGAYRKYSRIRSAGGVTGARMARHMLDAARLYDVDILSAAGRLSDHYDPGSRVLRLSPEVAEGDSLAALGVAAHEAGHALQHGEAYLFLGVRSALVPAANIGTQLAWPLFLLGLIASWDPLMLAGIAVFSLAVIFTLVTLPVEFDASRRALAALSDSGTLTEKELSGARAMLTAAALTYVAAAFTAVLNLLRLIALRGRRRD